MVFTTAVLRYRANPTIAIVADLVKAMKKPNQPADYLHMYGVRVTPDDNTAPSGGQSVRELTMHLLVPPFIPTGSNLVTSAAPGTKPQVFSTSEEDSAAGDGCRTILFDYLDTSGAPQSTTLTLEGTTPVALPADLASITDSKPNTVGAFGVNRGLVVFQTGVIVQETGPDPNGVITGQRAQMGVMQSSFRALVGDDETAQTQVFVNLMLQALQDLVGPVIADAPAMA